MKSCKVSTHRVACVCEQLHLMNNFLFDRSCSCRRNAFIHLVRILIGVGNKSHGFFFKNMNQPSQSCRKYKIKSGNFK